MIKKEKRVAFSKLPFDFHMNRCANSHARIWYEVATCPLCIREDEYHEVCSKLLEAYFTIVGLQLNVRKSA